MEDLYKRYCEARSFVEANQYAMSKYYLKWWSGQRRCAEPTPGRPFAFQIRYDASDDAYHLCIVTRSILGDTLSPLGYVNSAGESELDPDYAKADEMIRQRYPYFTLQDQDYNEV